MHNLIYLQNSIYNTIFMFLSISTIFYLFMIRPQIRKQKNEKKFQENLKKGEYIVTNSGIHGKILLFEKDCLILKITMGKIKIEKNIISKDLTYLRYGNKILNNKN